MGEARERNVIWLCLGPLPRVGGVLVKGTLLPGCLFCGGTASPKTRVLPGELSL